MKKQTGFTLIELVVVIVILGILAATAAPKFIDLTGDARTSVMEALSGSLKSARDMGHAKALVDPGVTTIAGETVAFVEGWPDAASIVSLLDLDADVTAVTTAAAGGVAGFTVFTYDGTGPDTVPDPLDDTTCTVTYTETDDSNVAPEIVIFTGGC